MNGFKTIHYKIKFPFEVISHRDFYKGLLINQILKGSNVIIRKKIALLKMTGKGIRHTVVFWLFHYYLRREQNCLCFKGDWVTSVCLSGLCYVCTHVL